MLVDMLPYQPAAADLLCFMATQQQCKEAFLDCRVLATLVDLLHSSGMPFALFTCTLHFQFYLCTDLEHHPILLMDLQLIDNNYVHDQPASVSTSCTTLYYKVPVEGRIRLFVWLQ